MKDWQSNVQHVPCEWQPCRRRRRILTSKIPPHLSCSRILRNGSGLGCRHEILPSTLKVPLLSQTFETKHDDYDIKPKFYIQKEVHILRQKAQRSSIFKYKDGFRFLIPTKTPEDFCFCSESFRKSKYLGFTILMHTIITNIWALGYLDDSKTFFYQTHSLYLLHDLFPVVDPSICAAFRAFLSSHTLTRHRLPLHPAEPFAILEWTFCTKEVWICRLYRRLSFCSCAELPSYILEASRDKCWICRACPGFFCGFISPV